MEDRGISRVQVLRFALTDNAPTERDAIAAHVVDGKHDAVEETVVNPLRATHRNVGIDHFLVGVAQGAKMRYQLSSAGSIPKVP